MNIEYLLPQTASNSGQVPQYSQISANKLQALAVTSANSSLILPAGAVLDYIKVVNNTANAITGGLKFGTTAGGVDIATGIGVGANVFIALTPATLLKSVFSNSATQTIFIDAVVGWNSASVDITVYYLL